MTTFTLIAETYGPPQPQAVPTARAAMELRDRLLRAFPQVSIWHHGSPISEVELAHLAALERHEPELHAMDVTSDGPLLPPSGPPLRVATRR